MNDFLKSLRANNKDKRFDRNARRNYTGTYGSGIYNGNSQYRGNEKGNGNTKKNYKRGNDKFKNILEDNMPEIKKYLQRIADAVERRADAEDLQAQALERIANYFKEFLKSDTFSLISTDSVKKITVSGESEEKIREMPVKNPDRQTVLNMIFTMRDKGSTYNEIANCMIENNIPTFSGKGRWHAQTIHRICARQKH